MLPSSVQSVWLAQDGVPNSWHRLVFVIAVGVLWLLCDVLLWLWLFVAACLRQIVVVSFVLLVAMAVLPWLLLASAAVAAAVCGILCVLDSGSPSRSVTN